MQIGCLVPAAGASRRMGVNKLQLPFRGTTVLRSTLAALAPLSFHRKVVVCREDDASCAEVHTKFGFQWVEGAKSQTLHESIRLGLATLNYCDAVLVALADQPWLQSSDYQRILQEYTTAHHEGFSLLRPWNGEFPGNPCVIHQSYFAEILQESDQDRGCSYLFQRYPAKVKKVLLPEIFFQDLDTPEDYQKWNS